MFDIAIQVIAYGIGMLYCIKIISDYLKQSKLDDEFIENIN